jgi:hypothetical protein
MDKPTPLTVELRASRRLGWLLGVVHSTAVILLLLLPLPWWLIGIASVPVIASAVSTIKRQALRRGKQAVRALQFSDRETLRARTGDGSWHGGRLLGSSTVGAGLAVLNLRLDDRGTTHVVITGDGVDRDDFRRLRVWLRWGPGPADSHTESS